MGSGTNIKIIVNTIKPPIWIGSALGYSSKHRRVD